MTSLIDIDDLFCDEANVQTFLSQLLLDEPLPNPTIPNNYDSLHFSLVSSSESWSISKPIAMDSMNLESSTIGTDPLDETIKDDDLFSSLPSPIEDFDRFLYDDDDKNNEENCSDPLPKDLSPSIQQLMCKSSNDENLQTNLQNGNELFLTGGLLELTVPPLNYQRVRYEKELKEEALRYIDVFNDGILTLLLTNMPHVDPSKGSWYLRITRLTAPIEPSQLPQCYHPYPVWLNEGNALVYNKSLLLPINDRTIQIKKLVLPRLRQNKLKQFSQYPIFDPNQFDLNNLHEVNEQKASETITEYRLRCSILHFQVVFIDKNNRIYPTDLQCQTNEICEYEGKQRATLVPAIGPKKKRPVAKRLCKTNGNKLMKKIAQPQGPPPLAGCQTSLTDLETTIDQIIFSSSNSDFFSF